MSECFAVEGWRNVEGRDYGRLATRAKPGETGRSGRHGGEEGDTLGRDGGAALNCWPDWFGLSRWIEGLRKRPSVRFWRARGPVLGSYLGEELGSMMADRRAVQRCGHVNVNRVR